jgi:hypothetical protein
VGCWQLDASGLEQGLVMGCCEHGNKMGNFLTSCVVISFSRRILLHVVS